MTKPSIERPAANSSKAAPQRAARVAPEGLVRATHLLCLVGFAVAQPLYDLLARNTEFFVARGSAPIDVVVLVGCFLVVLPGALVVLGALPTAVSKRLGEVVYLVLVAALIAATLLPLAKRLSSSSVLVVLVAGMAALAGVFLYHRFRPLQSPFALGVLLVVSLVFPLQFLFLSPVVNVVLPASVELEPGTAAPGRPVPVVVLVFDELPIASLQDESQAIDAERYPNFAALAEESIWYRDTTTVALRTTEAVPAILTGRYPDEVLLPTVANHPENLFTLLASSYHVEAIESIVDLCPQEVCEEPGIDPLGARVEGLFTDVSIAYGHLVLPEGLSGWLPSVTDTWGDFAPRRSDSGETQESVRTGTEILIGRFLESVRPYDEPTLYFLHILLPHLPWQFLPSGQRYVPVELLASAVQTAPLGSGEWEREAWGNIQDHQRHLLQVAYTDQVLGRILDRLRSEGLYDESLIVVTADHGINFAVGGSRRGFTKAGFSEVISVPLFIKMPGQSEGAVDDSVALSIDILPTITDVLELDLPFKVDGRSLLDPEREAVSGRIVYGKGGEEPRRFELNDEARRAALRRNAFLFGGTAGIFGAGPFGGLVGQVVGSRTIVSSKISAQVELEPVFESVQPETGVVPAQIAGRLAAAELEEPLHLAIAVNGRVQATTLAYREADSMKFTAMVDGSSFVAGSNEIELFRILGDDVEGAKLTRLEVGERVLYTLAPAEESGMTEVISSRGGSGSASRLAGGAAPSR